MRRRARSNSALISRLTKPTGSSESRIESGATTTASALRSSAYSRFSSVSARVWPVMPTHASTATPCVADTAAFVDHHARDLLAARIVEFVPFAGGAGGEDDVCAVAVLYRPAHDRALLVLEHLACAVEDSDDRHRQARVGHVAMRLMRARAARRLPPSDKFQWSFVRHLFVVQYMQSRLLIEKSAAKFRRAKTAKARDYRIPRPSRVMNV